MTWKITRHDQDPATGRPAASPDERAVAAEEGDPAATDAEVSGAEGEQFAASLSARGRAEFHAAHYAEAETLLSRALKIQERVLGPEHVDIVETLTNLAAAHAARGELGSAEPLLQRALSITEARFGPKHQEIAVCLNNLARLYLRQNELTKAEPLLLRLLDLQRSQGNDHPAVATIVASLAAVRASQGDYAAAEQLFRCALRIRERTLPPNHFVTASTLERLADACAAQGKLDEGFALLLCALEMRERTLSAAHQSVSATRAKIADLQLLASQEMSDSSLPLRIMPPPRSKPGKLQPELPRELALLASSDHAGPPGRNRGGR